MWLKTQAAALHEELENLLSYVSIPDFYAVVREPLEPSGRGLSSGSTRPWPLLPLLVSEAICGDYKRALPVAAAIQLLMASADVFDDIEDADSPNSLVAKYGLPVAVNAATALLIRSEVALARLKRRGVKPQVIVKVIGIISESFSQACVGQHQDLSFQPGGKNLEKRYLEIVDKKSASQIECACRVGAVLAGAGDTLVKTMTNFGRNTGMAAQIDNDIRGLNEGKDIKKQKITLPVIYALAHGERKVQERLMSMLQKKRSSRRNPTK